MNPLRLTPLVLVALALPSASALAADPAFTGFTLGATAGLSRNSIDYSGYIDGKSSSKNNAVGGLNVGYGLVLGDSAVLSFGASYTLNSTKFGQVTYQNSGNTIYVNGKLKDHWNVFVAPGIRFTPQWLGYAKVSYHMSKSDYTDTLMGSDTSSHHGVGFGLGAAYAVAPNIEISAEIGRVNLSRASFALSSGDPSLTELNVGVNYRF